jgi:type IV secretion system protein VirB10
VPRRSLVAGTLIEAQLHQPLRTDQPATVVATSLRPVYDLYQRSIVLPAGTRFLGTVAAAEVYDAGTELHWHRLITPDGRSLDLAEAAESTDGDGGAVNGRRRRHRWQKTGAVLVTALTSAALEAVRGDRTEVDIGATAGAEAATGTEALLSRWAQRTLARPPTIHLEAGTRLYIRVLSDLSL